MPNQNRRNEGSTLIEILVVIVVFLVGILAVVQIFPKGFQILQAVRDRMSATAMAKDEMNELLADPQSLPEDIVPVDPDSGSSDGTIVGETLNFVGRQISSAGTATTAGGNTEDLNGKLISWEQLTGYNSVRRIIGEGQVVPSPTSVGTSAGFYGGLMMVHFGPVEMYFPQTSTFPPENGSLEPSNLQVYGNNLTEVMGQPAATATRPDYDFYVVAVPQTVPTVMIPSGAEPNGRVFQVSFSGYVNVSGSPVKELFTGSVSLPQGSLDSSGQYPAVNLALNDASLGWANVLSVDVSTITVQRRFRYLPKFGTFTAGDPYEYKILDSNLGTLLFNPAGYNLSVSVPGQPRQALKARVNYDVFDWRVLHDDFRIDADGPATHQLPLFGLRTNSQSNVDGTMNTAGAQGFTFEGGVSLTSPTQAAGTDHFMLLDQLTGGVYYEAYGGQQLIHVDKNRGTIDFTSYGGGTGTGLQGLVMLPDGTNESVSMAGRPVRALYQSNKEWAVQVFKAADSYSQSFGVPSIGQYYIGGSGPIGGLQNRIYFPNCDTDRKVTIGQLFYKAGGTGPTQTIYSQDFVIHASQNTDPITTKLPYIDLGEVVPGASFDETTYGYALKDVKGASLMVRAIWNPDSFKLGSSPTQNVDAESTWGQSWHKATTETFLDKGVSSR